MCDGLSDCADGSDEEGCIEKTCCDKVTVDGLTFIRQEDRLMNGRPFYELEGAGEDVYLYYYHDGKKNRYWLVSKYVSTVWSRINGHSRVLVASKMKKMSLKFQNSGAFLLYGRKNEVKNAV